MKNLYRIGVTLIIAFCAVVANAQHKIIKAFDNYENTTDYFYNADGLLIWEQSGTTRREYTYDENGNPKSMTQYGWVEYDKAYKVTQSETYVYNADNLLIEKRVVKNPGSSYEDDKIYKYSEFNKGIATYYDEYNNSRGGAWWYMYKQVPEFDEKGQLTSLVIYYDDPDTYSSHEAAAFKNKDAEESYIYDENGNMTRKVTKAKTTDYTYTDLAAKYAPANLTVVAEDGDVTLSWDAVVGAEKYIVTYDQTSKEVTGTTETVTVGTGDRNFAVQAVIDGVARNASFVTVTIVDKGKLPVTDLTVGTMTKTTEETESVEAPTRDFFNIPLTWTLPEGHSDVVKFNIYYDSQRYGKTYVSETNPDATGYTLKIDIDEMALKDENGVPCTGVLTDIYVTVVYVTGESDKSNIVKVNPFKDLGLETGVKNLSVEATKNIVRKYMNSGKVVVEKNGKKYGIDAVEVK